eukprot:TRINITY_DN5987_c0_g1_i3.p1 TRINITY_DN5987_c0_g1~~TRINITY_DN5987_c0_g1_i3.p1  ORF type:complete len:104 (-),score=36.51 TRINITY_DN5987_c0_g1_i3:248-559(-)
MLLQIKFQERQLKENHIKSKMRASNRTDGEFENKCREEEALRRKTEAEVCEMEMKEAELIERLKHTQETQRNAYEELEEVLNLEADEVMRRARETPHSRVAPN